MIRITTAAAVTILASLAVAGCTAVEVTTPSDPEPSTSVEPSYDPADLDRDGKVTGWEREQLARQSYTLPDGTEVALPGPGEPMPQVVVDALAAYVGAELGPSRDARTVAEQSDYSFRLRDIVQAENAKLNRSIVAVLGCRDGILGDMWCVTADFTGGIEPSYTLDEAITRANAWIDARGGTDKYFVVVLP